MARLAGVNIPDNKKIFISLTYIYGIGRTASMQILKQTTIDPDKRTSQLTPDELNRIKEFIDKNFKIEGDLRRELMMNVRRIRDIGSWRGMRHAKRLPARGQRTRTNSRSVRGNVRKTVTSGRKSAPSPT